MSESDPAAPPEEPTSESDPAAPPSESAIRPLTPAESPSAPPTGAPDNDASPDYVRLAILSSVLLVLIGVFVYTRFINPPRKPFYTDLPGISLAGITPANLDQILRLANSTPCDCTYKNNGPCGYNVAECRHMDPTCDVSLKRAVEIVQSVTGTPAVLIKANPAPGAAPAGHHHHHGG